MTPKQHRLAGVGLIFVGVALAVVLSLWGLRENISFFYTPHDIIDTMPEGEFRLGGLVKQGSIKREGTKVSFIVSDDLAETGIMYNGITPDLFKEGQGVIAFVQFDPDQETLVASKLLAKHDENYMPPEVAKALKENGHVEAK